MMFGERNGFKAHKEQQTVDIDMSLRNRLYNWMVEIFQYLPDSSSILAYIVDKLGEANVSAERNTRIVAARFYHQIPQSEWYDPYTIIELFLEFQRGQFGCRNCTISPCPNDCCRDSNFFPLFTEKTNSILEEENSGYRLMDDLFVPITNTAELKSVQEASRISFESVRKHINKAIRSLSDKASPDYENSIKDAISAVEAMCCIITNSTGGNATLGSAIKKLDDAGVTIHSAMKGAFEKLYGYTSNAGGIRHGSIDFTDATIEDAQYMLVTCSAFVNYLNAKYEKARLEKNKNEAHEI